MSNSRYLRLFGADIGPTFMFGEINRLGFSVIPYAGFVLIPYGEFTFFKDFKTIGTGGYIKLPVSTNANLGSFGG